MNIHNPQSLPQAKLVSLHRLVDQMLCRYNRLQKDHKKFFINEVPRNLTISSGKNITEPWFANSYLLPYLNAGQHVYGYQQKILKTR